MARNLGVGFVVLIVTTVTVENVLSYRPPDKDQALTEQGGRLYETYCLACHGENLKGRQLTEEILIPPLVKTGFRIFFQLMPNGMEGFVADQIGEGIGMMPPYAPLLSEQQRTALAFFIGNKNTP